MRMKTFLMVGLCLVLLVSVSVYATTVSWGDKKVVINPPKSSELKPVVTAFMLNSYQQELSVLQLKNNELQDKVNLCKFKVDVQGVEISRLKEDNLLIKRELCKFNKAYAFCKEGGF